ncbi:exopolysaccharide biosynthesis polyprenyl glycosylphosphotransferase [Kutzneria buriramensis]|uniref:Exopolysaccharide biosynthesis polyprenyl glycosylphosphotransferase n=2 Tax=Kutzneria buriramensis TaxID=1045776 RepID=A0A3E0I964_9PSEU|nr:exopolysaccharide biosynthesis polyprenyl glycosylphosphotransferase [Kutzneria buriramensis]
MRVRVRQLRRDDADTVRIPVPVDLRRQWQVDAHPPARPITTWEIKYRRVVMASDLGSILAVVLTVGSLIAASAPSGDYPPLFLAGATVTAILASLTACRAWSTAVLGQEAEEFRRLGKAIVAAAVVLAVVSLGLNVQGVRGWIFVVTPTIALVAFPLRYILRQLLHRRRRAGRCLLPVMVAGSVDTATDLIARTRREPHNGWRIEAVCAGGQSDPVEHGEIDGVPVVGQLDDLADRVRRGGYRVVAVTPDPYWTPLRLQRLAWQLEGTSTEMVVAPVLMEVAGPRVHVTGVLGLPLLRVSAPTFTGARRVVKEIVDKIGALVLLAALSPVLLAIATAIRLGDRGPALYRQRRIGKDGRPFTILKFRTMVVDADRHRGDLQAGNEAAGPLFKMRRDPRVTAIGAVLRRFSIDELPQLFNVLGGTMSLVGPRPPLPSEVQAYGPDMLRRLLVKPGLTGLWQVSGRSDLPWDESVRLDLRYVEDWSLALDALILWKTVRAVVRGQGAY